MFDYDTVCGPIDLESDSPAIRRYKAGTGALRYALTEAGWSETKINNGLRTHFESIAAVLTKHQRDYADKELTGIAYGGAAEGADQVDPRMNPCGRSQCTVCHPEVSR